MGVIIPLMVAWIKGLERVVRGARVLGDEGGDRVGWKVGVMKSGRAAGERDWSAQYSAGGEETPVTHLKLLEVMEAS
jgi:hypothetical protein